MKTGLTEDNNTILYGLWQKTQQTNKHVPAKGTEESWEKEIMLLEQMGRGMEETIRYLYIQQPAYDAFIDWLKAGTQQQPEKEERLQDDVLTPADMEFWQQNGYIVVRNAITTQQAADAANAIWQHLRANPENPATWYASHEDLRGLMLTFYHHAALEANRRSPRIRRAYEQLYGTTHIHRNMDKVSFNPPENQNHSFIGTSLHWDVSLQQPIPFKLQGLLYLTDTDAANGAFHCVPGFHNTIGHWMSSLPEGTNPRHEALATLQPQPVTGKAGDFVIWHQALPHCATPNRGNSPRLVQYFTYLPPGVPDQSIWI